MAEQRRRRAVDQALPIGATLLLIAAVTWSWSGMWVDAPAAVLVLTAVAATLPALLSLVPHPRAGLATIVAGCIGAFLVVATATDVSIQSLLRLRRSSWSFVAQLLNDGIAGAATITIPLPSDPDSRGVSAVLIVLIAMAIFLIAAIGVVTRRPLAAIVTAGIAFAYRWTLAPPEHPLRDGLVCAAVALTMFALVRPNGRLGVRAPARLVGLGGAILLIAGVTSAGASRDAWWDWRTWSWGSDGGGGSVLSLNQSYGPLTYPGEPIELARVATSRLRPLRAVSLTQFDGLSFIPTTGRQLGQFSVDGDFTNASASEANAERMTVTLTGTKTPWLFTPGEVVRANGLGRRTLRIFEDGAVSVNPALGQDSQYTVTARNLDPGPAKLLAAPTLEPWQVSQESLEINPGGGTPVVVAPLWGATPLPPETFGQYAEVARLSREVVAGATTQYEAVNRIERYLRDAPFVYDEKTPRAVGQPELINFLLTTRVGYCQHFAGSMALMLRMNGIPARVAVGLNVSASRYDAGTQTYRVVDRDAHSWVEVDFGEEYGWLAFDPTPGRSAANSASVSSPSYVRPDGPTAVTSQLGSGPINAAPAAPEAPATPAEQPASGDTGGGVPTWVWTLPLLALVLVLIPIPIKAIRRARRRRGDERARVLGAAHELESLLADLGAPPDRSATPNERAGNVTRTLGIDADRIYGLASQARFSADGPPPGSGRDAWQGLRDIKSKLGWRHRVRAGIATRSLRRADDA